MPLPRGFSESNTHNTTEEEFSLPSIETEENKNSINFGLPPDEISTDSSLNFPDVDGFIDKKNNHINDYQDLEEKKSENYPITPQTTTERLKTNDRREKSPKEIAKIIDSEVRDYYDKQSLELLPYDSLDKNGEKIKVKVSDFDKRKNLRTRYKIATTSVIVASLVLIGFGVKQTFFPSNAYSEAKVSALISEKTGSYGFPVNSGRGFVQDFMKAYLSLGGPNATEYQSALGFFYTGENRPVDDSLRIFNSRFSQNILIGPTIYSVQEFSENSASFRVGALVQGKIEGVEPPADSSTAQWVFFSVNVFYNSDTQSFAIAKNSPTLVPTPSVTTDIPKMYDIGSGHKDEKLKEEVSSVISGFLKAYAESSPKDSSKMKPFMVNDETVFKTLSGLNNQFSFDEKLLSITAYSPTDAQPNDVKAEVKVTWDSLQGSVNKGDTVSYTSTYVATLQKQNDGGYKITKFQPEYYVPDMSTLDK